MLAAQRNSSKVLWCPSTSVLQRCIRGSVLHRASILRSTPPLSYRRVFQRNRPSADAQGERLISRNRSLVVTLARPSPRAPAALISSRSHSGPVQFLVL